MAWQYTTNPAQQTQSASTTTTATTSYERTGNTPAQRSPYNGTPITSPKAKTPNAINVIDASLSTHDLLSPRVFSTDDLVTPKALSTESLTSPKALSTVSTPKVVAASSAVAASTAASSTTSTAAATAAPLTFTPPAPQPKLQELVPQKKGIEEFIALINSPTFDPTGQKFEIRNHPENQKCNTRHPILEYTNDGEVRFTEYSFNTFLDFYAEHFNNCGFSNGQNEQTKKLNGSYSLTTWNQKRDAIFSDLLHYLGSTQKTNALPNNLRLNQFDIVRAQAKLSGEVTIWVPNEKNCSITLTYADNSVSLSKADFNHFLDHYRNLHCDNGFKKGMVTELPRRSSHYDPNC